MAEGQTLFRIFTLFGRQNKFKEGWSSLGKRTYSLFANKNNEPESLPPTKPDDETPSTGGIDGNGGSNSGGSSPSGGGIDTTKK